MEKGRDKIGCLKVYLLVLLLLLSFVGDLSVSALSVTVNDVECVYEYVLYEGDTVSGNFVVVDHDIFWSSDHPGIDLVVRFSPFIQFLYLYIFISFLISWGIIWLTFGLYWDLKLLEFSTWFWFLRVCCK